jgi:hypothetical protein
VSDFTSGTVASATTATSAGTASTAGTAFYSTTSGTSLTISGSITNSQVSDFASGTVANISGTVTQAQVTSLTTDLANRAKLDTANTFSVGGQIISSSNNTVVPLQLRRASATATANIQEWDTSTGVALATIDANAYGNFPRVTAGSTADLGYGVLSVNTGATATKGLVVRGAASQSANLQEWQNSGGTAIANISSAGVGRFENTGTLNGLSLVGYNQAGGHLTITRATATMSSPGANTARLYFRAGTNANTLKLVVLAGAAGAETTILDNIPT